MRVGAARIEGPEAQLEQQKEALKALRKEVEAMASKRVPRSMVRPPSAVFRGRSPMLFRTRPEGMGAEQP